MCLFLIMLGILAVIFPAGHASFGHFPIFAIWYFHYLEYLKILDNVDGKQARKTGNSSPLGLMVDHGTDSINTVILPLAAASIMQIGRSWYVAIGVACLSAGFYFATLEEYYTGRLDLPNPNGVSDGCVAVYLIGLLSAIFGCQMWKTPFIFGLNIGQSVFVLTFVLSIPAVGANLMHIFAKGGKLKSILVNASMLLLYMGTMEFHYASTRLSDWYMRLLFIMYGSMQWKILIHMMLSHVSAQTFQPFRTTILLSCAMTFMYYLSPINWGVSEEMFFWIQFIFNIAGIFERDLKNSICACGN